MLFQRSPLNPILTPTGAWWERRAVFNPGAVLCKGFVALVYRAVGADGISRFGLAWGEDGERFPGSERSLLPWYEGAIDDPLARLGVEDPRITPLGDCFYLTYCKVSVEPGNHPPLSWEPAPFRVRTGLGMTRDFRYMREVGTVLPDTNTKDGVLFPELIGLRHAALVREYPSIQYTASREWDGWSDPVPVLEPIPSTWEGERIGAGPPPVRTPWGWLLLYHGNEHLEIEVNRRHYRMGLAVLDAAEPWRVLYRHPDPVLEPEEPYEVEGPVGNVVFGTGLVELKDRYYLYYGAGDGVIGVAWAEKEDVFRLLRDKLGEP